ncbi:RGase E [Aspergillus flavus]|uniref:RGase E n=2 Tax=Aspergillus subgen. Circumdati TaxID=2720871 RepID=A0A5N6GFI0_ASPFL|nr:rhamnogalacturonase B [Aspergillus oryzae 3.042]KAB8241116.1 RGase E [Aspergillus flavus]KDE85892.1 rhamnogalacturonase B [Aspergillus oryzae 100-8]|eukprot:EIT81246.1 rhamnogalacturonase B [Aspergillus oryzae 3.042]
MQSKTFSVLSSCLLLIATVQGQLSGSVGPSTSISDKKAVKTCNVLDYGATNDNKTDVGQPIMNAFEDCGSGGVIYIPEGDYLIQEWVSLRNGTAFAIQLDGVIYRNGTTTSQGYMFGISGGSDFELYSSTSKGAIQGSGYLYHMNGEFTAPRLLHISDVSHWSVHDIALVDAPMFHFVIDDASNGEVYNMAIRGGNSGGLDGIDVSGDNIWIHDVMVTNKDECVTVKTGSHNFQIENIYCNWSGGCAMGSLGSGTNVSNIVYRNIYTWNSNQMYMIKSNGGDGEVSNLLFENFIGHGNAYSLDLDSEWSSMDTVDGDDGESRPPIRVICPEATPCTDITIEDVDLWTEEGDSETYVCKNAFGSGACLKSDSSSTATYATTNTVTSAPSGYSATTMAADLTSAFGTDASIPIPTIPTSFYPGATPYSALAGSS